MNITINLSLPDVLQLLVYLIIALVVVSLITGMARIRLGLSFLVVLFMALGGGWLFAHLLKLQLFSGVNVAGVPLIEATLGALLFGLVGIVAYGRGGSRRYA